MALSVVLETLVSCSGAEIRCLPRLGLHPTDLVNEEIRNADA